MKRNVVTTLAFPVLVTTAGAGVAWGEEPLASWNEGGAKKAIVDFVAKVTTHGSPDFVPVAERIAVFDHDCTLWAEKPLPFQAAFALDRVKALAPQHPEWQTQEPFASLLKGDAKAALAGGERAVVELLMATHAGMTADEFAKIVIDWIATAKHPKTGRLLSCWSVGVRRGRPPTEKSLPQRKASLKGEPPTSASRAQSVTISLRRR